MEPGPGQVRDINSYTLGGPGPEGRGAYRSTTRSPPITRRGALFAAVQAAFDDADVLVVTAGSSVSYRDLTAQAINRLGPRGVGPRRGRPARQAYYPGSLRRASRSSACQATPYPASTSIRRFVEPAIRMLLGAGPLRRTSVQARLARQYPRGQRPRRLRARPARGPRRRTVGRACVREIELDLHVDPVGRGRRGAAQQQWHPCRRHPDGHTGLKKRPEGPG